MSEKNNILELIEPPFKHIMTKIFNSKNNVVADVRGWGWIQKLNDPEIIHDALGDYIAEAMTEYPKLKAENERLKLALEKSIYNKGPF